MTQRGPSHKHAMTVLIRQKWQLRLADVFPMQSIGGRELLANRGFTVKVLSRQSVG